MKDNYLSPFSTRYASKEMQKVFSQDEKFKTWRKLWISLAKGEQKLGLPITDEQIAELEKYKDDINYDVAEAREKETRHDVMAHIFAYGTQCPKAKPIIHLGATSCFVGDNTDVILMRDGLNIVRSKLLSVISLLSNFALKYKDMPCLAYTHLQPAQLTTVGKRASLWLNEFYMDLEEVDYRLSTLALLGSKGTTGTQASFMALFDNDADKVKALEKYIAEDFGFSKIQPVTGQTYSRKMDANVLATLSGIAQSASKFANDMRILQSFKELEEPFEKNQVGSSAMPYKRNPMRCERISALSRYVIVDTLNPAITSATQWFERTLDDSANRRIAVAEGFLGVDSILNILQSVCDGIVVYEKVITSRVMAELPFMASENIMMHAVKKGGDRQALHEKIRTYSIEAGKEVKEKGNRNNLIDLIVKDPDFGITEEEAKTLLNPADYTGRAAEQTEEFVNEYIKPILEENKDKIAEKGTISI
jgi:adenylosuccinate lyase